MAAKNWAQASIATKLASIGMALSAILSIVIGFAILDKFPVPIEALENIAVVYVLLFFAIDAIVAIGLFFVKRFARSLTIYWAVLSVLSVVPEIMQGAISPWIIPNIFTVISGILLLAAGKDFKKEKVEV
jgi:hypothetical protein